jgi:hypothetical protein
MANRDELDRSTASRTAGDLSDWTAEDNYWRSTFTSRPYVRADRGYEAYRPGYRYGFESATRHRGRQWDEVESELRSGWDRYEHRGQSMWENVKDAVRDAWDRVTGSDRSRGAQVDASSKKY